MRELVEKGNYRSVSSAYDVAAEVLLEREAEKEAWWKETLRRCDEAEQQPERMLDANAFFREVRDELNRVKKKGSQAPRHTLAFHPAAQLDLLDVWRLVCHNDAPSGRIV
jgi:Arc/MetJ-type ribon-helix-helix transcriptional regulator